jgi:hypothetical protein
MVKQLIFDGYFGSNLGYIGGHFGCAYVQISVYELVNVTNGFLDFTNQVIRHLNHYPKKDRANKRYKTLLFDVHFGNFFGYVGGHFGYI